eukprot:6370263-Lingulodinium_polyedra.AAC.1
MAAAAGMPAGVFGACARYMDGLSFRLCLASGLGVAETHRCGIPQGVPFQHDARGPGLAAMGSSRASLRRAGQ